MDDFSIGLVFLDRADVEAGYILPYRPQASILKESELVELLLLLLILFLFFNMASSGLFFSICLLWHITSTLRTGYRYTHEYTLFFLLSISPL